MRSPALRPLATLCLSLFSSFAFSQTVEDYGPESLPIFNKFADAVEASKSSGVYRLTLRGKDVDKLFSPQGEALTEIIELNLGIDDGVDQKKLFARLAKLTRLVRLRLDIVSEIKISPTVAAVKQIKELFISSGKVNSIPDLSPMKGLELLTLDGIELRAWPETFAGLTSLAELHYAHAALPKNNELLNKLPALRRLFLEENGMSIFPTGLDQCRDGLSYLGIIGNPELNLAQALGMIQRMEALRTLDLSNNNLKSIPNDLLKLKMLNALILSGNAFSDVPTVVCDMPYLTVLHLNNNNLPGIFKDDFTKMVLLENLDISGNQIKKIPAFFSKAVSLNHVDISDNPVTVIEEDFKYLPKLSYLNADNTKLNADNLIAMLSEIKLLDTLIFSGEGVKGVPQGLAKLANLKMLSISVNMGGFPTEVLKLTKLEHLSLSNSAIDVVPFRIFSLSSLRFLDLSGNSLKDIPNELMRIGSLEVLDLSSNKIQFLDAGKKPRYDFSKLQNLAELHLEKNLPLSLADAKLLLDEMKKNPTPKQVTADGVSLSR